MAIAATALQQIMSILKQWYLQSMQAHMVRGQPALTYDDNLLPRMSIEIQARGTPHLHIQSHPSPNVFRFITLVDDARTVLVELSLIHI